MSHTRTPRTGNKTPRYLVRAFLYNDEGEPFFHEWKGIKTVQEITSLHPQFSDLSRHQVQRLINTRIDGVLRRKKNKGKHSNIYIERLDVFELSHEEYHQ